MAVKDKTPGVPPAALLIVKLPPAPLITAPNVVEIFVSRTVNAPVSLRLAGAVPVPPKIAAVCKGPIV